MAAQPARGEPVLRLKDVRVWVAGGPQILHDVDWEVRAGEHWAVIGPNGAGKSTLMAVAGGWRHPSVGTAEVLGQPLGRADVAALQRRIGWVGATAAPPPPRLRVRTVVLTGASGTVQPRRGGYDAAEQARAARAMAELGVDTVADTRFGACSDGERRRALLARALLGEPALLLLDEPVAGLDLPAREALVSRLAALAGTRSQLATVTVTHHLEELPASTSHVLLLRAGRVLGSGPVDEVLTEDRLSDCFGLPLRLTRAHGRWSATGRLAGAAR